MLTVGLTGGIGTGKSTVARMFQKLGAPIIDADQIARRVVEPHTPAWQRIVEHFGEKIVQPDGQLKRKLLAEKIFDSDRDRCLLNSIVHPPTVAAIEKRLEQLKSSRPQAVAIVDVPLLFEVEWPFEWDKIIVVFSKQAIQFARLRLKEPKLNQFKFKKRLRSQLPLEEKAQRADWVIDNNGSLSATREQVLAIYQELQQLASDYSAGP